MRLLCERDIDLLLFISVDFKFIKLELAYMSFCFIFLFICLFLSSFISVKAFFSKIVESLLPTLVRWPKRNISLVILTQSSAYCLFLAL